MGPVSHALPETMARLPLGRGDLPVPHIAAWSSERWAAIRFDPLVDHVAVFTGGRQGRGRPVFGVMNEPRQRAAVMGRRCGVCNAALSEAAWLPNLPRLCEGTTQVGSHEHPVTTEPPCCLPCALWSTTGCPGIARHAAGLLRIDHYLPLAQMVDPSRGPAAHDSRFDGEDDPAERERLGRIARRHKGAVGYVKVVLVDASPVAISDIERASDVDRPEGEQ